MHDGIVLEAGYEDQKLNLKIEIPYLADIINPDYSWFYLTLSECSRVVFRPWGEWQNDIHEVSSIFNYKINILEAKLEDGNVEISCSMIDKEAPYKGGKLIVDAQSIQVFDEDFMRVDLKGMQAISKRYWKNFAHSDHRLT